MDLDRTTSRRELARLSTTDSRSERRRSELQRLANVLTDPGLEIRVTFEPSGAFAHRAREGAPHDFEIHIPVERFEQVQTDQAPALWDRRVQFGLLFHELGHVMYSDFERFEHQQSELLPRHRDVYRTLFNAAEDVVIEAQLAAEFSLARDFETLNETFRRLQHRDHERYVEAYAPDEAYTYTVYEALCVGILEHGFGAESRFRAILDPGADRYRVHDGRRDVVAALAPDVAAYVDDMLALPAGRDRVDRSVAFFETVREHLADLPSVQSIRMQTEGFRPIEAGDYVIGSADRATDLPDRTPATGGTAPDTSASDSSTGVDATSGRGDTSRPGASQDDETGGEAGADGSVPSLLDGDRGESPLEREAAELLDLVQAEDVGLDRTGVVEPDDVEGDRGRWEAAKRRAEPLARDLRSTLRRRRRADERAGQRTGRIDPQRLARAAQGRDRVFKRRVRGDERDYRCLVVLDRSGSMAGDRIRDAESATAQLVHALHDVGVDVSVLSLLDNAPFLELPFGGIPDRYADALTAGRTYGWTPLTDTLEIARNRLDAGAGTRSFIVVVTDGAPDDEDAFLDQLDRCNVPVYGVYIDGDPGTHARFFDRIVYTDSSTLDTTLRALARQLLA